MVSFTLPDWTLPRGVTLSELDAAFALATAAVRLNGQAEDETALRDAMLLIALSDDADPVRLAQCF